MAKVSIAILNFNGENYLRQFLPSVVANSDGHEVIVIDNASLDNSRDLLKNEFPSVRTICLEQNLGFSGGYNEGFKQIDSEFVVLLNSDIEVTANWLDPIIAFMENDSAIAACQPKILDYNKKSHFEYAGASGGFIDILGYPFCRGRLFQNLEEDKGQYDNSQDVFWASGACLIVRKAVYEKVGGLEEGFFAHMEEIDLCWRFWNNGYRVAVCPEGSVYHVGGGTLANGHPKKTYLNFRNGLFLILKNEPINNLLWKIPIRFILDWIAAVQFSIVSGPSHGLAIIKSHIHFLIGAKDMYSKRKMMQSGRHIPTKYKGLIIWDYYFKKKKKHSDL
jgi:GT2 family glycosyltransferase